MDFTPALPLTSTDHRVSVGLLEECEIPPLQLFSLLQKVCCRGAIYHDYAHLTRHHQIAAILQSMSVLELRPSPSSLDFGQLTDFSRSVFDLLPDTLQVKGLLLQHDFYELTRMTANEFLGIYDMVRLAWLKSVSSLERRGVTWEAWEQEVSTVVHGADALLCWTIRADGGDTLLLAMVVGHCSRRTMERTVDKMTLCINTAMKDELRLETLDERSELYDLFAVNEKAVAVLDGTHCRIRTPIDGEEEFYSGYKRYHTQVYLILVNALGFFLAIDGPFPGRMNDKGAWNVGKMRPLLEAELKDDEVVIGDGGFVGRGPWIIPFNVLQLEVVAGTEREKDMLYFNDLLQLDRAIVEHDIHALKTRAEVLQGRFPMAKHKQVHWVKAAARILNWQKQYRLELRHL